MYKNIPLSKIKLLPEKILKNMPSEELLSDLPIIESFYQIRKLKACLSEKILFANYPINDFNQCFSPEFNICFSPDEFIISK